MRGVKVFIDSNVLLYANDIHDPAKEAASRFWLRALATRRAAVTNLQVLNEVTAVFIRKKRFADPDQVFAIADSYSALGDTPLTRAEVDHGRHLHRRFNYSWWDSLLLASALELGCSHFLSEDLQDGQVIEGLTIVDPFAHSPEEILASF